MENHAKDPTYEDVIEPNETKEQLHVDPGLYTDPHFEENGVQSIE
jgi:hypothetical protein